MRTIIFYSRFYITQSVCVQAAINNLICECVCNSHAEHSIMLPVTQKNMDRPRRKKNPARRGRIIENFKHSVEREMNAR